MSGQHFTAADLFNLAAQAQTGGTPPVQQQQQQVAAGSASHQPSGVTLHPILGIPMGPGSGVSEPGSPAAPTLDPLDALMATLPSVTDPTEQAPVSTAVTSADSTPQSTASSLPAPPLNLIAQPAAAVKTRAASTTGTSLLQPTQPVTTAASKTSTTTTTPGRSSVSSPIHASKDLISDTTSSSTKLAGRGLGASYTTLSPSDRQQFTVSDITMYQWDNTQYRGNIIAVSDHFIAYAIRGYMIRAIQMHTGHRLLFRGHPAMVNDIVCHPNKALSLFGSVDECGSVYIWKPSPDETELSSYPVFSVDQAERQPERKGIRVQWNPSSETQFAVTSRENSVKIWDFKGCEPKTKIIDNGSYQSDDIKPVAVFTPPAPITDIRSIAWSADGSRFIVACVNVETDSSVVYVLNGSDYRPMYSFSPTSASSTVSSISLDQVVYLRSDTLVAVANNGQAVQVWKIADESNSSAHVTCTRQFTLQGGEESIGIEACAHLTADGQFLVLADRLGRCVYIVQTDNDFAFISEYVLREPGLSFTPVLATGDIDGETQAVLKLYLVQTGAIQTYSAPVTSLRAPAAASSDVPLAGLAHSVPTQAVGTSTAPRVATPVAPSPEPEPDPTPLTTTTTTTSTDDIAGDMMGDLDSLPTPPEDGPGDFTFGDDPIVNPHIDPVPMTRSTTTTGPGGSALDALTAMLPALQGKVSVDNSPVTPALSEPVETPAGSVRILKRAPEADTTPATTTTTTTSTTPATKSAAVDSTDTPVAVPSGKEKGKEKGKDKGKDKVSTTTSTVAGSGGLSGKDLQRLEASLVKNVDKVFKARYEKMRQEQEKHNKALLRAMQEKLSEAVAGHLHKEIKKEILPMVKKTVKDHLDSSVMKPVNDNLQKLLVQFNQGVVTNIGNAVKKPLNHAFQKQFDETIVPSFERACSEMFLQLDATVKDGIAHNLKPTIDQLVNAQNQTTSELIRLRTQVAEMQAQMARGAMHAGGRPQQQQQQQQQQQPQQVHPHQQQQQRPPVDIAASKIQECNGLLQQGRVEEAFIHGLSAANLKVVDHLLNAVTPEKANGMGQRVLLPLLQQIGTGFQADHAPRKITWMLEVAMALDPTHPDIRRHVPAVLDAVLAAVQSTQKTPNLWQGLNTQQQRELRALDVALSGARRKV